jgi:ribosome biogenesis GTPase A
MLLVSTMLFQKSSLISDMAKSRGDTLEEGLKVMVIGMPNVGKSSLLNALRRVGVHKGKTFLTSQVFR